MIVVFHFVLPKKSTSLHSATSVLEHVTQNLFSVLKQTVIKMGLLEVGGGCGNWMELAEDRDRWRALVSTVMNLRVP